jgi:hypothetical protein
MTLAEQVPSIVFDGIEGEGAELTLGAKSLERLRALVLRSVEMGELGAVALEIATVMGFLSSRDDAGRICEALAALGDELRGRLEPHLERVRLDLGESRALRSKDAARWLGRSEPARAPGHGEAKAAIVSGDAQMAGALRDALQRARSGPAPAPRRGPAIKKTS